MVQHLPCFKNRIIIYFLMSEARLSADWRTWGKSTCAQCREKSTLMESNSVTVSDAQSTITSCIRTITAIGQNAGPFIGPLFVLASTVMEHCIAAKNNRAELLSLGDIVARTSLLLTDADHVTPTQADALRRVLLDIEKFVRRQTASDAADAAHRVSRFVTKVVAFLNAKDIANEIGRLGKRLSDAAHFMSLDLGIRTVTGLESIKADTEQLLSATRGLSNKIDELSLTVDQLTDLMVFLTNTDRFMQKHPNSELRNALGPILAKSTREIQAAAETTWKMQSSLPFKPNIEGWMISSLGVRYSPRDVIGRGATAIVYRGHYQGNTVAIKVFNEYVNDDSTRLENAIGQELDAWRRLSGKPHILKLIGACTKVAQPFIVSEYCIGNCIKYVRLNPEMLLRIIYEISIGLEQIHNIGVCHRDIKGNNILVTAEGRAAIADFGLSKNAMQMLSSSYATTRPISGLPTVGTLNWMSPEQYESPSKVTDRSDMWSFGMVLYELLAGYVPFYELSDGEIVEALKGDYVRPSLPEGLQCDPRLLRLLTMCWKREPRLRPQAAEVRIFIEKEFADDITRMPAAPVVAGATFFAAALAAKKQGQEIEVEEIEALTLLDSENAVRALTFEGYTAAAAEGDVEAQVALGNMYFKGENGVILDYNHSKEYFISAARSGSPVAQYSLGIMTEMGLGGIPKDYLKAFDWYAKAAAQKHSQSQCAIGTLYRDGLGVHKDYSKALEFYRKAANSGSADAENAIGFMYDKGYGVSADPKQAVEWYKKAAVKDHIEGILNLAWMWRTGRGVPKRDDMQAVDLYVKGASIGSSRSQHLLGFMFQQGLGVSKNYSEAVEWFKKAALKGHAPAQADLAYMYRNGYGVPQDYSAAFDWYEKSAAQNNSNGQNGLGFIYAFGLGVTQDFGRALSWYQMAADQENTEALNNLAFMYRNGSGVVQDYYRADMFYRKSAALGSLDACNHIGLMYLQGMASSKPNYSKAMEWFLKAKNLPAAQHNIGHMYENGLVGFGRDVKAAISWYKKAGAQGFSKSEEALARLGL